MNEPIPAYADFTQRDQTQGGEHLVRFVFDPWYYRYGVYAYYAGLFACLCGVVFVRMKWWDIRPDRME